MNSTSFTVVPILPASLDSTCLYLSVLGTLTSKTDGLPGWYPMGRLSIQMIITVLMKPTSIYATSYQYHCFLTHCWKVSYSKLPSSPSLFSF